MAEGKQNKKAEALKEHLENVEAFWNVCAGIRSGGGKHSDVKVLAALRAALNLYFAGAEIRISVD